MVMPLNEMRKGRLVGERERNPRVHFDEVVSLAMSVRYLHGTVEEEVVWDL